MSEKRAGGIFVSSFVAGLLLAAAVFAPRAWEPVPAPYLGLEDPGSAAALAVEGMEAAHAELSAREQVVLTLSQNGYGKRTSAYEIRVTGRGGKGIVAMVVNDRNGPLIGSFPVEHSDQIMLVTNGGQLIRCPVEGIRVAGRNTQGVIVFNTAADEQVVSVERISDEGEEDDLATDAPAQDGPEPTA
jgi:DNA gyrase subunit A